jgi:hypothetical protein
MRPLTREDYLLITIIIVAALAGSCALFVAIVKLMEEIRERGGQRGKLRTEGQASAAGVPGHRRIRAE